MVKTELTIIGIIFLIIIAYFIIGFRYYQGVFAKKKIKKYHLLHFKFEKNHSFFDELKPQAIHIGSGNLTTHGYLCPNKNTKKWIIMAHPVTLNGYEMSMYADVFYKLGYSVVSVDLRAHGESAEHRFELGLKEYKDLHPWCHHLIRSYGENISIYLFGVSTGANIVLLNANENPLPKQVKGVIADSPYSNNYQFFKKYLVAHNLLLGYFKASAFRFVTDNICCLDLKSDLDFADAYRDLKIPTLLIFGSKDKIKKKEKATLCSIFKSAKVEDINGGHHGQSIIDNNEEYLEAINSFLKKNA